jgi:glycosyltransferase involved in cell wall biosynthesis
MTAGSPQSRRLRISFLMLRAEGVGGVPRTVLNLANALADFHDVEVISVYRVRRQGTVDIDPRINVRYVLGGGAWKRRAAPGAADDSSAAQPDPRLRPSQIAPEDKHLTERADAALIEAVSAVDADVLIATKPSLSAFAIRYAPPGVRTVGQDHLNFITRTTRPEVRERAHEVVAALDAFVTLNDADARDYRALVPTGADRVHAIPNAVSWPVDRPAPLDTKIVLAAGRFGGQKAFPRLVEAYAPVAHSHPDWQLHIYGRGAGEEEIRAAIESHDVADQVRLMGYSHDFRPVMRRAAVYAMSSIFEGFPMVLLEAMTQGVPMVAYDVPRGPAEIIRDGANGRLIPDGDTAAFTDALRGLMDSDADRTRMGRRAWDDAHAYEMPRIVERWNALFASLMERTPIKRFESGSSADLPPSRTVVVGPADTGFRR